jgi:hypothetical protein
MEQKKEEKQKIDVVKKKGKVHEVTKRDERDKGGNWNGTCGGGRGEEERWEKKIQ